MQLLKEMKILRRPNEVKMKMFGTFDNIYIYISKIINNITYVLIYTDSNDDYLIISLPFVKVLYNATSNDSSFNRLLEIVKKFEQSIVMASGMYEDPQFFSKNEITINIRHLKTGRSK